MCLIAAKGVKYVPKLRDKKAATLKLLLTKVCDGFIMCSRCTQTVWGRVVSVHNLGHIHYENNTLLQWQNDVDLSAKSNTSKPCLIVQR